MKSSILILFITSCAMTAFAQNVRQLTGSGGAVTGTSGSATVRVVSLAGQPLVGQSQAGDIINGSGFTSILRARNAALDALPPRVGLPTSYEFLQNYPNPFNPSTEIVFGLSAPANVSLRIYDGAGRLVRGLAAGIRPAGAYREIWDGRDASGRAVSSGIYFYRLDAGAFSQTRKMVLLR